MVLNEADRDALARLAADERAPLDLETAIRLERLGLVMGGWGDMHVLTEDGRAALDETPPPA